jgi:uncharacterized protein YuzE
MRVRSSVTFAWLIQRIGNRHVTTAHMTQPENDASGIDLRYDATVDMGYLYLRRSGERGTVATTRMWWDDNLRTELALDFDSDGHLIGIELFSMSHVLRPEIFALARPYERD